MNENILIGATIANAARRLEPVSDSPRLDAELLLARALDVARSYLFAHPEEQLDPGAATRFEASVLRLLDSVPLAYITGEKEFWSMNLMVSPATLVPRPETEILVEQALRQIPEQGEFRVLDLGTGCGAVAIAIARERVNCEVAATDCSEDALAVARENARQLDIPNVSFVPGDWVEAVADRMFDIVVSNPPYVPAADPDLLRLKHEPLQALAAGMDGLDAIRSIARESRRVLREDHFVLVEHGDRQQRAVEDLLQAAGWHDIACVADLAGRARVSSARR